MNALIFSSNSPYSEIGSFKGTVGGAEINLRLIAEELGRLNHNVYYYSTKRGMPVKKNINGVYTYHYSNIYIPRIHKNIPLIKRLNKKIVLFQQKKHIEKIIKKKKIDIIHTYSTYPDTFISIKAAMKYNIPIVQQVAGRAWYNALRKNSHLKDIIEWTFSNVDMLLFVSDFMKGQTHDYFEKLGMKVNTSSKIVEIGINYNQFKNLNIENVKRKYSLSDDEKIILCIGAFKDYSKRQDILIKAMPTILKKFDNVRIIFAGDGPNLQQMIDLANNLRVNQKINFLGKIPHEDVLAIMSIAEIIVHPTEFEGLSNIIKESMALGTPIVASNIKANKLIEKSRGGYLVNNTPIDFANKIIYLLRNKDVRKSIGQNAAAYAKEHFNSKKNILKYEKLFSEKIEEKQ